MEPLTNAIMKVIFFQVSFAGVTVPFVLIWLLAGAIFFTFYFKFINIRGFGHALDVVRGKYDDPNDAGEVSHFQALTAALSGTVGVGNIAGMLNCAIVNRMLSCTPLFVAVGESYGGWCCWTLSPRASRCDPQGTPNTYTKLHYLSEQPTMVDQGLADCAASPNVH